MKTREDNNLIKKVKENIIRKKFQKNMLGKEIGQKELTEYQQKYKQTKSY
jgi:hypothetical protein